jgi:hypothetical protein
MVAAAVVFVTGMIAGMVSDESIGRVVGWFEPLWLAISFTLATIVSIVSLIASPLLLLLVAFFELVFSILGPGLRARLENVQLEIPVFPAVSVDEAAQSSELFTPEYTRVLTGLIMVSVILLVALALRGLFRMTRPPADLQRDTVNPFEGLGRPARPGLGLATLAEAWPDNETEAELITQAYNDAHYGELPESDEELQHILDAWERLTAVDSSQK